MLLLRSLTASVSQILYFTCLISYILLLCITKVQQANQDYFEKILPCFFGCMIAQTFCKFLQITLTYLLSPNTTKLVQFWSNLLTNLFQKFAHNFCTKMFITLRKVIKIRFCYTCITFLVANTFSQEWFGYGTCRISQ